MAEGTYSIGLQERLNSIAHKYKTIVIARIRTEIDKLSATRELVDSLKVRVVPATSERSPEILVHYSEHGDFIGKRKLLFTRNPPIDPFVDWMEGRGVTPSRIPGYKGEAPNLSEEKKRKRFAFAISEDKRQNDTHKRRQWKKKALPEVLRQINVEIIEAYKLEIEREIVKSLTTNV